MQHMLCALVGAATVATSVGAGAYLSVPAARQVVYQGAFLSPDNLGGLNAGGPQVEGVNGHGVCGGTLNSGGGTDPMTSLLEGGVWGATNPQATYIEGSDVTFEVTVPDHQYGWFEFRLCKPSENSNQLPTTQDCLNRHVLKLNVAKTKQQVLDDKLEMRKGLSSPADMVGDESTDDLHIKSRCANRKENVDPNDLRSAVFPRGSCCTGGGLCTSEEKNEQRWVLPHPTATNGRASVYNVHYKLPSGVVCPRCVLQMFYVSGYKAAGQPLAYPAGVWNCADIEIVQAPVTPEDNTATIIGGVAGGIACFVGLAAFYTAFKRSGIRCCVVEGDEGSKARNGGDRYGSKMQGGSKHDGSYSETQGSRTDFSRPSQQQQGNSFNNMFKRISARSVQSFQTMSSRGTNGNGAQQGRGGNAFLAPMAAAPHQSMGMSGSGGSGGLQGFGSRLPPPPPPPGDDGTYDSYGMNRDSLNV